MDGEAGGGDGGTDAGVEKSGTDGECEGGAEGADDGASVGDPLGELGDGATPTEAFDLLGDETRLAILEQLARRRRINWQWEGMTFAELRRAVGMRDAGNFSYHLEKLEGTFVVKDGDEYKLLTRGFELAGALAAGTYTEGGEPLAGETDHECPIPDCSESMRAVYDNQFFRLTCERHDVLQGATLPPGVAEHKTVEELVDIATRTGRRQVEQARTGVCPHCWGPTETTLPAEDPQFPDGMVGEVPDAAVFAGFACDRCGMAFWVPAGVCVVDHPAVVSLFHEHGEDVHKRPTVTLPFATATHPVVESTDPARVRVDVQVADDRLSLWLDGEAAVVDRERE